MSPEQLAAKNTESGHQKALFAWANMAKLAGFEYANDMTNYHGGMPSGVSFPSQPVFPCLQWLHSIPNGGARDPVTAARMKAEGVKKGIPDVFLPFPRAYLNDLALRQAAGLYIELKKEGAYKISDEQSDFANWCGRVGYVHCVAIGWRQAANMIERYLA